MQDAFGVLADSDGDRGIVRKFGADASFRGKKRVYGPCPSIYQAQPPHHEDNRQLQSMVPYQSRTGQVRIFMSKWMSITSTKSLLMRSAEPDRDPPRRSPDLPPYVFDVFRCRTSSLPRANNPLASKVTRGIVFVRRFPAPKRRSRRFVARIGRRCKNRNFNAVRHASRSRSRHVIASGKASRRSARIARAGDIPSGYERVVQAAWSSFFHVGRAICRSVLSTATGRLSSGRRLRHTSWITPRPVASTPTAAAPAPATATLAFRSPLAKPTRRAPA